METKTIAVIYDHLANLPAIEHNQHTLEELFEGYVSITNYYFDQMQEDTVIEADAFLLSNTALLAPLRPHISDFKKIVLMKRSIQKAAMSLIMDIPEGSDVLVVNDSFDSSVHTAHALYELGIGHLNLIPFNPDNAAACGSFQYALTPGESRLVPPQIPHVIDFLYRVISFDTLLQLSETLHLTSDITSRNLIKHLNSIAERDSDSPASFLNSHLKTQIINLVVQDLPTAILVVNTEFQLVYSNEQADRLLLSGRSGRPGKAQDGICSEMLTLLKDIKSDTTIELNGGHYMVEKVPLMFMDQPMGCCFTFHSESHLREMESNLSRHLHQNGLIAKYHFQDILHVSSVMEETISIARRAASTNYTVLIHGESGTGKELLAQSIHNYSDRSSYPFVAINCNTLPESLLESQLFGYEGGSFTGAQKSGRAGVFEQANHGTIFLDEIGDISPNLQSQLLRVLQEQQVMRIGSDKIINLDVRIIAASNQDLETLVASGRFRSDLFYRLSVIPIEIPPLRQRQADILPLLRVFLGDTYAELTDQQKDSVRAYPWPGNVRQLENAAKYYETFHDFPSYLRARRKTAPATPVLSPLQPAVEETACQPAQDLDILILSLIARFTEPFHGIGRSGILSELKDRRIRISDGKLRQLLVQFRDNGLITIERGRGGCRITQEGEEYLRSKDPS